MASIIDIFNAKQYIESFLNIRTKEGKIVPFKLNTPQNKLYGVIKGINARGIPIRVIILKARQMGFSTLTEALIFHKTAVTKNERSLVVAHTDDATSNIFKMSKLFYETLDDPVRPMKRSSNAKELIFENPSKIEKERLENPGLRSLLKVATAGGHGIGRSATYNNVHLSEYAFWTGDKRDTLNGILQTVPDLPGTMVIIESTANGFDEFKEEWDRAVSGESGFVPVFFAWHEMSEYRRPYDGFDLTDEEKELKSRYKLDNEQIAWRRWCIANNCGGNVQLFNQEYPGCPDDAFISTGDCYFDKAKVIARRNDDIKPLRRFTFTYKKVGSMLTDIKAIDDDQGYISIFEEPKKGYPYVLGGDTAGEGSDYFAGQVLDNTTGKQVAVLHGRLDEDYYAEQMVCLGYMYNTALIGVEINFSTHPQKVIESLSYPRMYMREVFDDATGRLKKAFGFQTTSRTRPHILAELKEAMRDDPSMLSHFETLGEALTFCKNEHGRTEALPNKHDDLIMALAIANHIRAFQDYLPEKPAREKKEKWTQDMLDDYYNASESMRRIIEERWGTPD